VVASSAPQIGIFVRKVHNSSEEQTYCGTNKIDIRKFIKLYKVYKAMFIKRLFCLSLSNSATVVKFFIHAVVKKTLSRLHIFYLSRIRVRFDGGWGLNPP